MDELDWVPIADMGRKYRSITCGEDSTLIADHYILPLDFITDFGLTASDFVAGVHITFLTTSGSPYIAGAYIISPPCSTTSSQLSVEACDSYVSPSGAHVWDSTGTYTETLINSEGCDSIVYVGLIIHDSVNTTVSFSGAVVLQLKWNYKLIFLSDSLILRKVFFL